MNAGGCLCGAVRYRVKGPLRDVVACHCAQCRRSSGHHVAATSAARADIAVEGPVVWYGSSPGVRRGFCPTCGSNLFWDAEASAQLSIFAGTLDQPSGLRLKGHIFVADKGDYYAIADGLPQAPARDPRLTTVDPHRGPGVRFTVAIDGPAAAGKGTIARAVARTFGFAHLDTGTLYRAVGLRARAAGTLDPARAAAIARALAPEDLGRADLRSAVAGQAASEVAALPEVRSALLEFQRDFARRAGGAVLDGRDIGTVVCPEAEAKLYVTAADAVRARRRLAELGAGHDYVALLADLGARDRRDSERAAAPLRPAPDALLLDTTDLTIDAAVAEAVAFVKSRFEPEGA